MKKPPKGKYAWTATVGEKGQIVIPKQARELFGIHPGDTILLLGDEARGLAIPRGSVLSTLVDRVLACAMPAEDEEKEGDAQ